MDLRDVNFKTAIVAVGIICVDFLALRINVHGFALEQFFQHLVDVPVVNDGQYFRNVCRCGCDAQLSAQFEVEGAPTSQTMNN